MVRIHLKRGDASLFLYETTTNIPIADLLKELSDIYNAILKIRRLCSEIEMLAEFGIAKPTEAVGLTDEQISELKITDEWTPRCVPSGGSTFNRDDIGRRTGNAPTAKLAEVLTKTCADAKKATSKDTVLANQCMTMDIVNDELDKLKGAVMIVYPMGLPPYDEVQHILNDTEDLTGREEGKLVIPTEECQLWWANKELMRGKHLHEYVGKNEKTKIVAKIQRRGGGAPVREPVVDDATQKAMMAFAYKKQEELKKLEEADDDSYLNAAWANPNALKGRLQGTGNIGFGKLR
eukprot:m.603452 g.603452  ORF g.603452 m.603452 type:complete len:292 (+) comp22453_c0_seq1:130-1005(+)